KPLLESREQARFPDPRLARQQYNLTVSCFRPAPTPPQQFHFVLTANEWRQCRCPQCPETIIDTARAEHFPDLDRFSEPFEPHCAKVTKLKQIANQAAGTCGNHDGVRLGQGLQPRGKVWRLADNVPFSYLVGTDEFADDDQPGANTDANLQPFGCS